MLTIKNTGAFLYSNAGYLHSKNTLFLILVILSLLTSVAFHSRAFMLGSLISGVVTFDRIERNVSRHRRILMVLSAGIVSFLLAACFKVDSSLGRIFIYKICFRMLLDNLCLGVGLGLFGQVYPEYQADYFAAGKYTPKELLLADNTRYAFNDYLQFIVETGLPGLLIISIGIVLGYKLIKCAYCKNPDEPVSLNIANFLILALLIAAVFTHVFDRLLFQLVLIGSILTVLYYNLPLTKRYFCFTTGLICTTVLLSYRYRDQIQNYSGLKKYKEAKELADAGFSTESISLYASLYPVLKHRIDFLNNYSAVLFIHGDYQKASVVLEELIRQRNSSVYYSRLAYCYRQLGNEKGAENAWLKCIAMVPNRFMPRYDLFKFYLASRQKAKAIKTAREILRLPVKIPSEVISDIKADVDLQLKYVLGVSSRAKLSSLPFKNNK